MSHRKIAGRRYAGPGVALPCDDPVYSVFTLPACKAMIACKGSVRIGAVLAKRRDDGDAPLRYARRLRSAVSISFERSQALRQMVCAAGMDRSEERGRDIATEPSCHFWRLACAARAVSTKFRHRRRCSRGGLGVGVGSAPELRVESKSMRSDWPATLAIQRNRRKRPPS